jgi:hypothetical protein
MMAMSEERPLTAETEEPRVRTGTIALGVALGLVLVLAIGMMSGAGVALLNGDADPAKSIAIIAGALLLAIGSAWWLVRLKPWGNRKEPVSPRTRKANNLLLLSGGLGGLIGAALSLGTLRLDDPFALFSNGPMPPAVVIPIIAVWLLIVPVISVQWHRNVDEHEAEAYKFGGIAALYLYAFVTPAWWLAWRAGLVPAPETMIIYLAVIAVMGIGWFWRRNR